MAFQPGQIDTKNIPAAEPSSPSGKQVKGKVEAEKIAKQKEILEEERIYRKGVVSIRDVIAPAGMKVESTYLVLNESYVRTMFVVNYPRHISLGWFTPIINMNHTLDVAMYFYPVKANVILKQLKKKVGTLEAQIMGDSEKGAPRDPIREQALRDIEDLRDLLSQGLEHFFQFALYVTLYAKSKEELDRLSEDAEAIFGAKLIYTKRVFYQAEQGFNSTLPLGNDELMTTFNMNSSPVASSFPFISADLSSEDGILFGINRHNNSLILFDRFSMQNANYIVFATSGAGKSYTVKLEILRSLMMGTEVIVIDPEMEYKDLSDAVGGTFINVSLASEAKINPFDLPRAVGEQVSTEDIIRSAVITVKGLLRLMLVDVSPQEDSILDRALLETYAKKDITADADLNDVEPPIIQDFIEVLDGMEGTKDIVIKLKKFTEGTFAGLFNSPTTVTMSNILVIYSVRDLEDELRPLGIYSIVNYIWNVVRSERKKRILVIDEAWWLMQNEDSAKFVFALVKRCRKYFMGVTTITQDVNDFLRSDYGKAIVTNSAMQMLLKQSPASTDLLQKTFLLTDGEKFLLLECGVGEGIFFAGNKHAAIKVVASYAEDQIVTTNPAQLLEISDAKEEFAEEMDAQKEAEAAASPEGGEGTEAETGPGVEDPSAGNDA